MSLAGDYKRQFGWRASGTIFNALPPKEGRTVLDLGCAVGDQTAELVARGARVVGIDIRAHPGRLVSRGGPRGRSPTPSQPRNEEET